MTITANSLARKALARAGVIASDNKRYQDVMWSPLPGPQTQALESDADVIGFGGAGGGGKTDLLLGKALTQYRKSIIFRPHFTDLVDIVTRGDQIMSDRCSFVWGIKRRWDTPDGRQVELGAIEHTKDQAKYRGRPHDFIGIDEAADFSENIFRFVTGWLRTTVAGQRTQIMLTFNPPSTPEGEWVVRYFAPWLDGKHAKPAMPGELRWFIYADNQDIEVDGPEPIVHKGNEYRPKSRTFIPARLADNPYIGADYINTLDSLPEPLRSQLLFGDFNITAQDDIWQVIPTEWVRAAMRRGDGTPRPDLACRMAAGDVARGGHDKTVIAQLYGNWFAPLLTYAGAETPDGDKVAELVMAAAPGNIPLAIDVVGVGASPYDTLRRRGRRVLGINNGAGSDAKDKSRRFGFANVRAESYWKLREALDPTSGEAICLPNDRELLADLCAARYKVVGAKYQIESKDEIKRRIGRSPDKGDAVVMAWYAAQHIGRSSLSFA